MHEPRLDNTLVRCVDFWSVCSIRQAAHGDKMKEAREGPVIKGLGFREYWGRANVCQVHGEHRCGTPGAGPVGWEKGIQRRNNGLPNSVSITQFPNPAALSLKLFNLVPLHVSQAFSELLPLSWSLEQVNFCMGPLEEAIQSHRAICQATSFLLAFKARCYGDSSFQLRGPGQGRLVRG